MSADLADYFVGDEILPNGEENVDKEEPLSINNEGRVQRAPHYKKLSNESRRLIVKKKVQPCRKWQDVLTRINLLFGAYGQPGC